jgi:anti-sigma factor RsiW
MAVELTCQELVELVTDYLEGKLGWRDRRRVAKHLSACDACVLYVAQMRETLDLLGTVPVDTLSAEAQSTLLDAFRHLKR